MTQIMNWPWWGAWWLGVLEMSSEEDNSVTPLEGTLPKAPDYWHCCETRKHWMLVTYLTAREPSTWHLVSYRCWRRLIKTMKKGSRHHCLLSPEMPDRDFILRLNLKPSLLLFLSFTQSLAWKSSTISCISQSLLRGAALCFDGSCHQKLWSAHDARDPPVLSVTSFSGECANEATIRKPTLTPESTAKSAEVTVEQRESSDSTAKPASDESTAPSIFQLNKEVSVLGPTPPATLGWRFWGSWTEQCRISKEASWLKEVTPSTGTFWLLWLWWICVLGSTAPKCAPDTGNYPAYTVTGLSLACRVLSKALNACSQSLSNKQMISLRPECQKRNKDNGQL